ncbi:MAG: hypothetical protein Fur0035_02820 [Anaerolineales bacterium]
MKRLARPALLALTLALLMAACAPSAAATQPAIEQYAPLPAATAALPPMAAAPESAKAADANNAPAGSAPAGTFAAPGSDALSGAQIGRMVIKSAELRLLVADTDNAMDRTLQAVGDVDGYVVSSRVWFQGSDSVNYKYATLTIGVPASQFENAMRRFRAIALKVEDENASGQDVSSEFVDLQSQLTNLQATRDRIRSFLADAKTVDESLRINQELSAIEAQIEQVQGRMNYLSQRSAFSTITLTLEPDIPPATPTPTPTPIPTESWNPGKTFNAASQSIVIIYQKLIELLIWILVVLLPLLIPPALILWLIYKVATRRK